MSGNFNPRPPRGRLEKILLRLKKTAISIHAPREGGDCRASTQAPVPTIFQSTPRAGGATGQVELVAGVVLKFFNPRPREGGDAM